MLLGSGMVVSELWSWILNNGSSPVIFVVGIFMLGVYVSSTTHSIKEDIKNMVTVADLLKLESALKLSLSEIKLELMEQIRVEFITRNEYEKRHEGIVHQIDKLESKRR